MTAGPELTRLVLVLLPDGASEAALGAAAGLARAMGLELRAMLLEDERILSASAHGFAAELLPGAARPRRMETARVEAEFGLLARRTERRLSALAGAGARPFALERVRGRVEAVLAARLERGDLPALVDPGGALDRALGAGASLAAAVSRAGATLTLPDAPGPGAGAVVALPANGADAGTCALAARIAGGVGAPLELWARPAEAAPLQRVAPPDALVRPADTAALDDLPRRRPGRGPRLIVLGAGLAAERRARGLALARRLRVPVLALGPGAGA